MSGDVHPGRRARSFRLQLLSDLHLESESFDPEPAPGADALILAGDIDATWAGYERFARWPVPVFAVAGNHEFDGREWLAAWPGLRAMGDRLGIRWLEQEEVQLQTAEGLKVRLLGCTRWNDFDAFGPSGRAKAARAARHFLVRMRASQGGVPLDAAQVRELGLGNRRWLERVLATPDGSHATVVVTHFAPSLRCADPRYGLQPSTASFCNADDDLMGLADLWLHGHLHSRHDMVLGPPVEPAPIGTMPAAAGASTAPRPVIAARSTRVVSGARGLGQRGESDAYERWPQVVEWHEPLGDPGATDSAF